MANCEPLSWLVETPSRDIHHYRMMNASLATVHHCNVARSREPCVIASQPNWLALTCGVLQQYLWSERPMSKSQNVKDRWHANKYLRSSAAATKLFNFNDISFPSHYLPPQNSGPCNSFYCIGHFRNVYDAVAGFCNGGSEVWVYRGARVRSPPVPVVLSVYQRGSLLDGLAMYLSRDMKKFHDNESTHILHNFWMSTHRGEAYPSPLAAPLLWWQWLKW